MKYIPRTLHIVRSGVVHLILGGACCFTAFPFLWMAVSSLKTKEEVMAVDTFLPSDSQRSVLPALAGGETELTF